jgi:hypothetical protein
VLGIQLLLVLILESEMGTEVPRVACLSGFKT